MSRITVIDLRLRTEYQVRMWNAAGQPCGTFDHMNRDAAMRSAQSWVDQDSERTATVVIKGTATDAETRAEAARKGELV